MNKITYSFWAALGGAILLTIGSLIQKLLLGYPIVPLGFIAPFFSGLIGGGLFGWIFFKQQEKEKQLLIEKTKAEMANKSKSEFLANISHDLRTPIHAISSFSNLALKRVEDEKARRFLENIKTSTNRLLGLINGLLDLSKLEAGKMVVNFNDNNLTTITNQCIEELSSIAHEKSLVVLFDTDEKFIAELDSKLISQVIINLLSNAIKFSPTNGVIYINIQMIKSDNSQIFNGVLQFSITDQGCGIPAEDLDTIFDAYAQSKKAVSQVGGTGLGLSVSKEIINSHKGTIWAESPLEDDGSGSSFYFIIPIKQ